MEQQCREYRKWFERIRTACEIRHVLPVMIKLQDIGANKLRCSWTESDGDKGILHEYAVDDWCFVERYGRNRKWLNQIRYLIWLRQLTLCCVRLKRAGPFHSILAVHRWSRASAAVTKHGVKDGHASMWIHTIFGYLPSRKPSTDQYGMLHDWSGLRDYLICQEWLESVGW
jgi:hypothetical protein